MALKVATWNLQEKLAWPDYSDRITDDILALDADLVVLPDSFWLGNPLHVSDADLVKQAEEKFAQEGYASEALEYADSRWQWPNHYLMALSRIATHVQPLYTGTNDALDIKIAGGDDQGLRVIGTHFDDASEQLRLKQTSAIMDQTDLLEPTAIVGDLNAMHANTAVSRLARGPIGRSLAAVWPDARTHSENEYARTHGRLSKPARVVGMADGGTMQEFANHGFRDSDPRRRPTMPGCIPMLQLDHIMVNELVDVSGFKVHSVTTSDHRPISATLSV